MRELYRFLSDDSGAVTVDWVVLTAAIVGIAIAVIGLISGGIQDASNGILGSLNAAGEFTFGGSATAGTMSEYFDQFGDDFEAVLGAVYDDAPEGYFYVGAIDTATDAPIYGELIGDNLSVDGQVMTEDEYLATSPITADFGVPQS